MDQLTSYIHKQSVIKTSSIQNWWENFRPDATASVPTTASAFYTDIYSWLNSAPQYRSSIIWVDTSCNSENRASCDPTRGIAHSKIASTLKRLGSGTERFETVNGMRKDLNTIFGDDSGKTVFPFSNNFLYWEENGVIDSELTRNLVIAAGVVFMIICMLIPRPRIALIVSLGICMSIIEIVGYMHWWGLTINGTTTINILICLGLSVDYSAHIAHIFKESVGVANDRAVAAMTRIGPSVFHAIFSTFLAVIVLAFSKSYVFVSFFKILFLVTFIAGFKGLWLLPVVLSLLGGDQDL
jgi:predicted RND superfamily exporter protein